MKGGGKKVKILTCTIMFGIPVKRSVHYLVRFQLQLHELLDEGKIFLNGQA